jgi:hypothetical protein
MVCGVQSPVMTKYISPIEFRPPEKPSVFKRLATAADRWLKESESEDIQPVSARVLELGHFIVDAIDKDRISEVRVERLYPELDQADDVLLTEYAHESPAYNRAWPDVTVFFAGMGEEGDSDYFEARFGASVLSSGDRLIQYLAPHPVLSALRLAPQTVQELFPGNHTRAERVSSLAHVNLAMCDSAGDNWRPLVEYNDQTFGCDFGAILLAGLKTAGDERLVVTVKPPLNQIEEFN